MQRVRLQRCDSWGSDVSDEEYPTSIDGYDCLFRHRCEVRGSIFYYRTEWESRPVVYNDTEGVTRCKACRKKWQIHVEPIDPCARPTIPPK
jgi:hypothetical protein